MAMSDEERKKRIAELKKQIASNRKREKKDNRSLDSLIGKAPKKAKKKQAKKKVAKKSKSAEDLVNDLRKGKGHLLKKNK